MSAFIFGDACEREELFLNVTCGWFRTHGYFCNVGEYSTQGEENQAAEIIVKILQKNEKICEKLMKIKQKYDNMKAKGN